MGKLPGRKYLPYTRQASKIPIVGPWYVRMGKVYNILSTPCDPDPMILVYAAFWHAPKVLVSLFGPDCIDDKFTQFQKGLRPHRKALYGIAGILPAINPGKLGTLGWAAFRAAEFAQGVGWWMLIGDATTDFLLQWTSTAYRWQGCAVPGTRYARGSCPPGAVVPITGAGTWIFDLWHEEESFGCSVSQHNISAPGPEAASVSFSLSSDNTDDTGLPTPTWNAQLVRVPDGTVINSISASPNGHGGYAATNVYWNLFEFIGQRYIVVIEKTVGVLQFNSGFAAIYAGDMQAGLAPGACGTHKPEHF